MKKNLRLLCLGLVAAAFTSGFAQEAQDMTSLLKNTDMEQGMKGWAFDGTDVMGKHSKNPSTQIGFHGMNNGVQESWHSNAANPLGDSYVMQRLSKLPSGTYVFGAYAAAAKQHNRNDICERVTKNNKEEHVLVDGKHQYTEYWSNRDSINGVVLFANDATVRVATDNPDLAAGGQFWGHSSKFNVAVTLTDADERKGYLDVGMRVTETNANYIVWDNATLYYFGNMSEDEALDAMAEIDMTKAAAIADTLKGHVMQNDTLIALEAAIAAAAAKTSTAATLWEDSKAIHEAAALARKSITDYTNLMKNIESVKKLLGYEWSDYCIETDIPLLEEQIAVAEAAYEEHALDRAGLTELRKTLNWFAAGVKLDSLYTAQGELDDFIEEVKLAGPLYTALQLKSLQDLAEELTDTFDIYWAEYEWEYEDRILNPNDLVPYIARVYAAIEDVRNNPSSMEYTSMPIVFNTAEDGWIEGATWYNESKKIVSYTSPTYRFEGKISNFRITVKKAKNGTKYFCLSELEFFDGNGQPIELDETMLSTNADHNTLNPGAEDGGGIAALFDGEVDGETAFFHSAWKNMPAESHYLEVNLPNGGYDAFSFRMLSRSNSNGYDQSHTFPGEMIISTPMPKREALEATLEGAKSLNAYSNSEVGFYEKDFSYVLKAIADVEAALVGWPSESECETMDKELERVVTQFSLDDEKSVNLPKEGVQYRFISAVAGYYQQQSVEKAMTFRNNALYWENVCADSLNQVFELCAIMDTIRDDKGNVIELEHHVEQKEGQNSNGTYWSETYYCYTLKNAAGRYVQIDSVRQSVSVTAKLVDETKDTIRLKSLGAGQWNIIAKPSTGANMLHTNGHGNGSGKGSDIVAWNEGINTASAWFIREMPELPLEVLVKGAEFKSECIHFDAANTITLTADKNCAFTDLALYDLYGNPIAIDSLVVSGKVATITATTKDLVGCAFAFSNKEGVSSVWFNAFQFTAAISLLQDAYDAAIAVAPEVGTAVMQYADIADYTAAVEKAAAMLETGATDEQIEEMIKDLEDAVAALKPNMPVAGKYYYIYNALDKFEDNHGYKMALYTKESQLWWAQENECEWNRLWQFVPATEAELNELNLEANTPAYYIKSVATGEFVGKVDGKSSQIPMASKKSETVPYTITSLQQGIAVALATANDKTNRLHGAGHGEGKNKSGSIVYWNSGVGTASMWAISEAEFDLTDIDFAEVETEKAVVKGTFDLFGRRVVAPTAPGLYIIDGKKKYIKK